MAWRCLPSLSVGRHDHGVVAHPSRDEVLVFGGHFGKDKSLPYLDTWALRVRSAPAASTVHCMEAGLRAARLLLWGLFRRGLVGWSVGGWADEIIRQGCWMHGMQHGGCVHTHARLKYNACMPACLSVVAFARVRVFGSIVKPGRAGAERQMQEKYGKNNFTSPTDGGKACGWNEIAPPQATDIDARGSAAVVCLAHGEHKYALQFGGYSDEGTLQDTLALRLSETATNTGVQSSAVHCIAGYRVVAIVMCLICLYPSPLREGRGERERERERERKSKREPTEYIGAVAPHHDSFKL